VQALDSLVCHAVLRIARDHNDTRLRA
jgi:hypothetical protein